MSKRKIVAPEKAKIQEPLPLIRDSLTKHWSYRYLPVFLQPYAQLARWERPIGWQLLFWPCYWSLLVAAYIKATEGESFSDLFFLLLYYGILFLVGAFVMRGAGCTYNDLIDHKWDQKVERTKARPLPSGRVSRWQAKIFMLAQLVVGFFVLLQFNKTTIILGVSSLILIAVYPFMKRITYWPQLVLGCAFNWGSLLGWTALLPEFSIAPFLLYMGAICWTIGYDTIYAHQDREDDLSIGLKSTALLFGETTGYALMAVYGLFVVCFGLAFFLCSLPLLAFLGLFCTALHLGWQIYQLNIHDSESCLRLFRANCKIGFMLSAALWASIFYAYWL